MLTSVLLHNVMSLLLDCLDCCSNVVQLKVFSGVVVVVAVCRDQKAFAKGAFELKESFSRYINV